MIKLRIGNNLDRKTLIVSEDITIRSALEDAELDYRRFTPHLNGVAVTSGNLDATFAEMGITDSCTLLCVEKQDNA